MHEEWISGVRGLSFSSEKYYTSVLTRKAHTLNSICQNWHQITMSKILDRILLHIHSDSFNSQKQSSHIGCL